MSNWSNTTDDSKKRWEQNADCWDERMGDSGNRHTIELVIPDTDRFLSVKAGEKILDVACGNGIYSRKLAGMGAQVTAFDYSENMIMNARKRSADCIEEIDFRVIDATNYDELTALGEGSYDKAVSNMGIHDISDIEPLFKGVHKLLNSNGIFVFSTMHPCFKTPGMRKIVETEEVGNKQKTRQAIQVFSYITPQIYEGIAIVKQPVAQFYYHRPLSEIFRICFDAGFAIIDFTEPVFTIENSHKLDWTEIPAVIIVKLVKADRC